MRSILSIILILLCTTVFVAGCAKSKNRNPGPEITAQTPIEEIDKEEDALESDVCNSTFETSYQSAWEMTDELVDLDCFWDVECENGACININGEFCTKAMYDTVMHWINQVDSNTDYFCKTSNEAIINLIPDNFNNRLDFDDFSGEKEQIQDYLDLMAE